MIADPHGTDAQVADAIAFLELLFAPEDWIELRLLPARQSRWVQLHDQPGTADAIRWAIRQNQNAPELQHVYFGANPRAGEGGRKAEDVTLARALFADFDDGCTPDAATDQIRRAGLPEPSIVVTSGGGTHAYWLLDEPCTDLAGWTAAMKRIIAAARSDKAVHDAPRIMRLPGTRNVKADRPGAPLCHVVHSTDARHPFATFAGTSSSKPPAPAARAAPPAVPPAQPGELCDIGRRFLQTGQVDRPRRENLFTIACDMQARGWTLADATAAIMARIHLIVPALTAEDIADQPRQIANAYGKPREPGHQAGYTVIAAPAGSRAAGPVDVADRRTWNHTGYARRVVAAGAGRIRYVTDRGTWVRWTGTHWVDDPKGAEAVRIAKAEASRMWDELHAAGPNIPFPLVKFVIDASNRGPIEAAVALARSEPAVEASAAQFDADPDALNVRNGILDLRTRQLRPHDPAALLTRLAPVDFQPAAGCPRWLEFIDAVTRGDQTLAAFLQRSFGLALSADQSEQRLWIHHGDGSNGKGTAFATLNRILGDYSGPAPIEILVSRKHDADRERGVAGLIGKRLAFAQEADDGVRLSEASVKALTSSDPQTGRFLYQNAFTAAPTWHLHLCVNDRPVIRGNDHGIWRRVMLVPWAHTFAEHDKRPRAIVEAEFAAEAAGILNWLLDGYQAWRTDGLRPPEAVTQATDQYRSESDSVALWVADACAPDLEAEWPATELFNEYHLWCKRAGFRPVTQTKFGRSLDALGYPKGRPRSGHLRDRTVRIGLRVLRPYAQPADGWHADDLVDDAIPEFPGRPR